jgi:hypothetical protein
MLRSLSTLLGLNKQKKLNNLPQNQQLQVNEEETDNNQIVGHMQQKARTKEDSCRLSHLPHANVPIVSDFVSQNKTTRSKTTSTSLSKRSVVKANEDTSDSGSDWEAEVIDSITTCARGNEVITPQQTTLNPTVVSHSVFSTATSWTPFPSITNVIDSSDLLCDTHPNAVTANVDVGSVPLFPSRDAAFNYFQALAKVGGFSIGRGSTKTNSVGDIVNQAFNCSHHGVATASTNRASNKQFIGCGCKYRIRIAASQSTQGMWRVTTWEQQHNGHNLLPPKMIETVTQHRSIPENIKSCLEELCAMPHNVSASTLVAMLPALCPDTVATTYSKKDLINLICRIRAAKKPKYDANALLIKLRDCKEADPDFFYDYCVDGEYEVEIISF